MAGGSSRRASGRSTRARPSPAPIALDLSPNGRVVATDNAFYSTYYDPRRSEERPTLAFRYVDFFDFRRTKEIGRTDAYYDYGVPSWIDSERVLTTGYGIFNAQVLEARVGKETRGSDFFRNPGARPEYRHQRLGARRRRGHARRRPVRGHAPATAASC